MKLSSVFLSVGLLQSVAYAIAVPVNVGKRATASTTTLTQSVWEATSSTSTFVVTPYAFDGVTVSASSASVNTTPWVSLDSSGVPSSVTPTVSGSSTTSASPTPTNTNYPTAIAALPVLGCFNDRVTSDTSFCISNGTEMVLDETYWITWNPFYWSSSDVVSQAKVKVIPYTGNNDTTEITSSDWIDAGESYFALTITQDIIDSSENGYIQLYLSPFVTDDDEGYNAAEGPVIQVVSKASSSSQRLPSDNDPSTTSSSSSTTTTASSSSKKKSKAAVIAPAVVVPVVVVGAIFGLGVFYFFYRKRKTVVANKEANKEANNESYKMDQVNNAGDSNFDNQSLKTQTTDVNPFK